MCWRCMGSTGRQPSRCDDIPWGTDFFPRDHPNMVRAQNAWSTISVIFPLFAVIGGFDGRPTCAGMGRHLPGWIGLRRPYPSHRFLSLPQNIRLQTRSAVRPSFAYPYWQGGRTWKMAAAGARGACLAPWSRTSPSCPNRQSPANAAERLRGGQAISLFGRMYRVRATCATRATPSSTARRELLPSPHPSPRD